MSKYHMLLSNPGVAPADGFLVFDQEESGGRRVGIFIDGKTVAWIGGSDKYGGYTSPATIPIQKGAKYELRWSNGSVVTLDDIYRQTDHGSTPTPVYFVSMQGEIPTQPIHGTAHVHVSYGRATSDSMFVTITSVTAGVPFTTFTYETFNGDKGEEKYFTGVPGPSMKSGTVNIEF